MAGRERSFRVGAPEPAEHQQILDAMNDNAGVRRTTSSINSDMCSV